MRCASSVLSCLVRSECSPTKSFLKPDFGLLQPDFKVRGTSNNTCTPSAVVDYADAAYGCYCTVTGLSFLDVVARVTDVLKADGFGVLTDRVDVRPYRILGACAATRASGR